MSTELVRQACAYIDAHLEDRLTLGVVARAVSASPFQLHRTFRRLVGLSPRAYARARRIERLRKRLRGGETVTRAVYEVGFGSPSRLYERSNAELGMTPATVKRGGRGMSIEYSVVPSPLGRLLVGTTRRGICAVSLGEGEAMLVRELRRQYPYAAIRRARRTADRRVRAIVLHLEGRKRALDLPIDVQATAFQLLVWRALREIPYGKTRTYRALAKSIGRPKAWRAVGRACATNPVAIVVPCHRAVREDGGLGGYRWGLERKRRLLDAEGMPAAGRRRRRRRPRKG